MRRGQRGTCGAFQPIPSFSEDRWELEGKELRFTELLLYSAFMEAAPLGYEH